jgi:hypothetical protein
MTCPRCQGRGFIEIHTISNDTCDGKPGQSVRRCKCSCFGTAKEPCSVPPPLDPEPSAHGDWPPGAEAMP